MFSLECAMDELASQLRVDPVELRLRNLAEADPNTGNPCRLRAMSHSTSPGMQVRQTSGRTA